MALYRTPSNSARGLNVEMRFSGNKATAFRWLPGQRFPTGFCTYHWRQHDVGGLIAFELP